MLVAFCSDGRGGAKDSKLDLGMFLATGLRSLPSRKGLLLFADARPPPTDDFIHNSNGILACHGISGVEGRVPGGANCPHPHTKC